MEAIKDDTTASLDGLTGLADETLDFYRDLTERVEDASLRQRLQQAIEEQAQLVDHLTRSRQRHGGLPQVGDAERGHVLAMLTTIRALAVQNDSPIIERLIDANRDLCEAAQYAAECELRDDARTYVEALAASCRSLGAALNQYG